MCLVVGSEITAKLASSREPVEEGNGLVSAYPSRPSQIVDRCSNCLSGLLQAYEEYIS